MILVLINVFSETMGISNIIPAAQCDLELTSSSKGILSSMAFFGKIIVDFSPYPNCFLNDKRKKKKTKQIFITRFLLSVNEGIMVSSFLWGYLGDTQGRRIVMLWTLLFSTIFTIISAFAQNFSFFLACRFMTGFL